MRKQQIKQLTRAEKRKLIEDRLRITPELSDRAIAMMLGVSPTTVGSVRRELSDKTVQNGQSDTNDYNWTKHPYLLAHPEILENISERSLRALKAPGVLDLMAQRGSKSPRYCQRLLYQMRKANKTASVKITEDDVKVFVDDIWDRPTSNKGRIR
ncbi:hypothetical protein [Thermoanaerobacterium sp. R66]|uniref:hypothetical protein n=1 Tax=Thermoanaerobacterium sp. R66 TaxID=2742479 RepID=UPI00237FF0AA|nr:hypothetical protein [Thermoanaerobacterium sp. R66]MDE4541248.1 hypothetical protein [Thermoanaerobacterium sp. R66]